MFRKSDDKKNKGRSGRPRDDSRLAQFGLLGVGGMEELAIDADEAKLEQELLLLMGQDSPAAERPSPAAPNNGVPVALQQLDRMVAECMEDNDDVEVTSDDENDSALMDELLDLDDSSPSTAAPPPQPPNAPVIQSQPPAAAGASVLHLLEARIQNYERAEAQATIDNETSRVRRFSRGLKTLQQMRKKVLAGKAIDEEDIPPEVVERSSGRDNRPPASTPPTSTPPASTPPASTPPTVSTPPAASIPPASTRASPPPPAPKPASVVAPAADNEPQQRTREAPPSLPRKGSASSLPHSVAFPAGADQEKASPLSRLEGLQAQYRSAALEAKQRGDKQQAVACLRTMKQLQPLVLAARQGQEVDMASLPPPPGHSAAGATASSASVPATAVAEAARQGSGEEAEAVSSPELPPVAVGSVLQAMQDRMAKYAEQLDKAKSEGNSRKERMNQRIIKQYQDAIKRHKLGKPVDYQDLPTPPGFPPLPAAAAPAPAPAPAPAAPAAAAAAGDGPSPPKVSRPQPDSVADQPKQNVRSAPKSRVERQMSVLLKRQEQFKDAALDAKKRGEIEQAKEYMRNYKGFNSLLEATAGGLPVDMNTVPVPPQEQASVGPRLRRELSVDPAFEVINAEDCLVPADNTPSDLALIYTKLEEDLIQQIKMCATTREHFKAVGDVASSNRFEQLIVHSKKDLDAIRLAFKRGDKPPRCHYENRSFSIVQCNTELNDSDCEVTVVRGINYNVQNPTDVDTYVKVEFPYPTDNPPQDRTEVVRDTNNPEYSHTTVFSIDRKTRTLARVFKRHSVKLTVHAKGGWFHRDTVVGIAKVPLVALENKCTLHDSFDLSDERKKKMVGGKLEVKVRVRNPILCKEIKQVNEKWLVMDGF